MSFMCEGKLLLVRLGSLGSASGTRPHCCTPILFPLVVVQTRPDIRVRVRRIVTRIRVRHTAIRIRVVVAAIDHTAYGNFYLEKCVERFSSAKVRNFSEPTPIFHIHRRASPVFIDVFVPQTLRFSLCASLLSLRSRFTRFRLRYLDGRLVRCYAFRFHYFTAEGQTRPDIRARVRRNVTRIRVRHTATRIRVAAAAIDHTACRT